MIAFKELIRVQRVFILDGVEDKKKIDCFSWKTICLSKEDGCLGIKHCGNFNLALLSKWKWRILKDENAIWNNLLSCRLFEPLFHYAKADRSNLSPNGFWTGDSWNWKIAIRDEILQQLTIAMLAELMLFL
ncbi:hypothetical protein KIW84_064770 [Lathyrus oleraceus]|uniref:Uncharacterized protein n=1 Tax=Pisum sativum TaxID=3888 RepID=A0A9D4WDM0_PEA|nr:hypothetical protein KIW84_064770 [Pisum sativum]